MRGMGTRPLLIITCNVSIEDVEYGYESGVVV
jgi:hypothetical protein